MLCSFYGWSIEYVESLDYDVFYQFFQAIEVIKSQETLRLINASTFPNLKINDQRKKISQLQKSAYPNNIFKSGKINTEDLATIFGG